MHIGSVMVDLSGTMLSPEERELLLHPHVGGVILFAENYQNKNQLRALIDDIRTIRQPLIIAVDQEGGKVQRFINDFTVLPSLTSLGREYDTNPAKAIEHAEETGYTMAEELLAVGIDISLAPVLDLERGISQIITVKERSFHADPHVVIPLAKAYIRGMNKAGMVATGKHFPGHGGVVADSHVALPVDDRDLATLEAEDMLPFAQLVDDLWGIMPAHVQYTSVDANPTNFSSFWLQKILREKLGFKGVIISDDMCMVGAKWAGNLLERTQAALAAGCDMVIISHSQEELGAVLSGLSHEMSQDSANRLLQGCCR